ncbi:hypothetical protein KQI01_13765, partial [Vibrio cholerae]|nr:hypothetical protein [Vibrio cholerae]
AANKGLRTVLAEKFEQLESVKLTIPPLSLCTDNAAMIAAAGTIFFEKGQRAQLDLNGNPGLDITIHNEKE